MESYKIVKFGIFDDFSHDFGKEIITNVCALNTKELIVSTTSNLFIIDKKIVKKRFPIKFSAFTIVPDADYLIGVTIKEGDLNIYHISDFLKNKQSNNSKNSPQCIEKFSTNQHGITHIFYSPKSNLIITVGSGIKVFNFKIKASDQSDSPTISITKYSHFSPNYIAPAMTPPAFDKETELILLPTENGICTYSLNGAKLHRCSKNPSTAKTIYATYPTKPSKLAKLISIPSTNSIKREHPVFTKEILTYDVNEGMNLWGSKGQLINHFDTIRSSVLSIIFIDSENAICINSCNILFYLNIKTGKTFYYMNLERSPSRLFLIYMKNEPILCACFGARIRALRLIIPWRVWNLNLEKTLSMKRCNKFMNAARILIDAESSFIKLISPRKGKILCSAKTNESYRPVSYFYDRGIFENFVFNPENSMYESKVIQINDQQKDGFDNRDTLFIVLQNGQILGFNPLKSTECEEALGVDFKASFMTFCRFKKPITNSKKQIENSDDFQWGYAVASEKGDLYIFEYFTLNEIDHFTISDDVLLQMFYVFDNNCIIMVFPHKTVLFDIEKGKIIDTITVNGNRITAFFSNFLMYGYDTGHILRIGIENKKFVVYNNENKKINRDKGEIVMSKPHSCPITGFSFAQKIWISAGLDGNVIVWNYNFNIVFKVYLPLPLRSCLIMNGKCDILVATATEIMQIKSLHLLMYLKNEGKIDDEVDEIDNFDLIIDDLYRQLSNGNNEEESSDEEIDDLYLEYEEEINNKNKMNQYENESDDSDEFENPALDMQTAPISKLFPDSNSPASSSPNQQNKTSNDKSKTLNNNNNKPTKNQVDESSNKADSQKVDAAKKKKDDGHEAAGSDKKAGSNDKNVAASSDKNKVKPADKNSENSADKEKGGNKSSDKGNSESAEKSKGSKADKAKSESADKEKAGSADKNKTNSTNKTKSDSGDKSKTNSTDKTKSDTKNADKSATKDKTNTKDKDSSKDKTNTKDKDSSKDKTSTKDKDSSKDKTSTKDKDSSKDKVSTKDKDNSKDKSTSKEKDSSKDKSSTKDKDSSKDKSTSKDKDSSKDKESIKGKDSSKDKTNTKDKDTTKDKSSDKSKTSSADKSKADSGSNEKSKENASKKANTKTKENEKEDESSENENKINKSSSGSNTKLDKESSSNASKTKDNNKQSNSDSSKETTKSDNTSDDSKSNSSKINKSNSKTNDDSKSENKIKNSSSTDNTNSKDDSSSKVSSSNSKSNVDSDSKSNKVSSSNSKTDDNSDSNSKSDKKVSSSNSKELDNESIKRDDESNKTDENSKINQNDENEINSSNKNEEFNDNAITNKDDEFNQNEADSSNINNEANQNQDENETNKIDQENKDNENNKNDQENKENENNKNDQENKENENNKNDQENENEINQSNKDDDESNMNDNKDNELNQSNNKDDENNKVDQSQSNQDNEIQQNNQDNQNTEEDGSNKLDQNEDTKIGQENENNEIEQEGTNDIQNEQDETNDNEIDKNDQLNENDQNEIDQNDITNQGTNENEINEGDDQVNNQDQENNYNDDDELHKDQEDENQNHEGENLAEDEANQQNNENENNDESNPKEGENGEENKEDDENNNKVTFELPFTGQYVRVPPPNVVIDKEELFELYESGRREFKPLVEEVQREEAILNNWHNGLNYVQNMTNSIASYEEYQKQKQSVKGFTLPPKKTTKQHANSARAIRNDVNSKNNCFITANSKSISLDTTGDSTTTTSKSRSTPGSPSTTSSNRSSLPRIKKLFYPASYVHNYNNNFDTDDAIATPRLFGRFSNIENMVEEVDVDKNMSLSSSVLQSTTKEQIQLPPLLYSQPINADVKNNAMSSPVRSPAYNRTAPSPRRRLKQTQ